MSLLVASAQSKRTFPLKQFLTRGVISIKFFPRNSCTLHFTTTDSIFMTHFTLNRIIAAKVEQQILNQHHYEPSLCQHKFRKICFNKYSISLHHNQAGYIQKTSEQCPFASFESHRMCY